MENKKKTELLELLQRGNIYKVTHIDIDGNLHNVKRVYYGNEKRFKTITCFVFSSRITKRTTVNYDPINNKLTMSGRTVPKSELSIPGYCIKQITGGK